VGNFLISEREFPVALLLLSSLHHLSSVQLVV